MAEKPERQRTWWIFFGVRGFDITNEEHDLHEPLFQDATIVSKNHISQIVDLVEPPKQPRPQSHRHDLEFLLGHADEKGDFHSFIAVRRTGQCRSKRRPSSLLVEDAQERAYGIIAALALACLAHETSGKTFGLVEQLHLGSWRMVSAIELMERGASFQIDGLESHSITQAKDVIRLSRQETESLLAWEPFAALAATLVVQHPALPKSLRNAVSQAAVRLSDAVHAPMAAARLLGAVTAMEILLSHQGEPWESIGKRLMALMGPEANDYFRIETVFKARHLYVHQGRDLEDHKIATWAIGAALSCLMLYAEAAQSFSDKPHLLAYLDIVYQADQLASKWTEDEALAFGKLLRHIRRHHRFAWLDSRGSQG